MIRSLSYVWVGGGVYTKTTMTAQRHGKRSTRQNFCLVRRIGRRVSEMHANVHTVCQNAFSRNAEVQPSVRNCTEREHRLSEMRSPEIRKCTHS